MSQAGVGLVRPAAAAREDAGHGLVELWKSRHLDEEHSSHFGIVEVVYEGIKCLAGSCPGLPTPRPPAPDTYWQVLERKASVSSRFVTGGFSSRAGRKTSRGWRCGSHVGLEVVRLFAEELPRGRVCTRTQPS